MEFDLIGVGKRLKEIRSTLRFKQKDFANSLNTSVTNLSDIETGKKKPGVDLLFLLSKVFEVNLDYLFHGEGEMFRDKGEAEVKEGEESFDEFSEDVKEILWYMRHSRLATSAIVTLAKEYLYKNEALIEKDIQVTRAKKEKDKE